MSKEEFTITDIVLSVRHVRDSTPSQAIIKRIIIL